MSTRFVMLGWLLLGVGLARGEEPAKAKLAVRGFDPVELSSGKESHGLEDITIVRDGFEYRFANPDSRATFEKSPTQYAIQYGGACMRMGPLSGKGNPERFAVHDGRIYLFASPQCMAAFQAAPDRFVDEPDEAPQGTAAQRERAAQLLNKAIDGLGGAQRVKTLDHVVVRYSITQTVGQNSRTHIQQNTFQFPRTLRVDHDYGQYKDAWLLNDKGGYFLPGGEAAAESVREYMTREMYHQPVAILKAHERGETTSVALGAAKVGDTNVEQVAVAIQGSTTTLSIDPASGHVLQVAYRGRTGVGIGQIVKTYSDFRAAGGLTIPFAVQSTFEGKPAEGVKVVIESVRVDEPLEPGLLDSPRPG